MTGAPSIGVTAFKGSIVLLPGITVSILQSKATHDPQSNVTGTKNLWLDEPNTNRAIWGTANPIKEMGPQNAVVVAVRIPVQNKINMRVRFIFIPRFAAYISPNNKALSGFINKRDNMRPINVQMLKNGS